MTKYTDTNANWEAEQREELIAESKRFLAYLESKRADAMATFRKNPKRLQLLAIVRSYDRKIVAERSFLASEGVEF